ncbi:hypothetical protein CKO35_04025 [Ectothiorhodospira shaposhnikovii]|uniref:glycosyltransferase n=1 Tax=Ectothiorhodospira shaposhnikovii TaxID=1054 RepID=UPI001906275C|nr:glycosyltransferase [Ectothiorhodospira shaposhnikovii]MBK1672476.1 hypothetical protein [Ectothiorhodospira shaposhnikovii]
MQTITSKDFRQSPVDVIVPVYRNGQLTRACIESVLASRCRNPWTLVVVDDASPEPDLCRWLDELAGTGRIELVRNRANQGFVRSVNRGMSLHPDRDVVLLNSDTLVYGDWLDRLRDCAWAHPVTGTVTPLSNNATLASYPRFMADNPLPEGFDAEAMDRLCARLNAGMSVTVPTAVGFCMYIRRDCLEATGYFDARSFGRGYGEENDFCRRAVQQEYEHRLCGGVFVWHAGGSSFGESAGYWQTRATQAMREKHPDYDALVAAHVAEDPQRVMRRRLDLARLQASTRPRVLAITHRQGGGVEQHLMDMARILDRDIELLSIAQDGHDVMRLRWLRPGEEDFSLWFRMPQEQDILVNLLRWLAVGRIHVHHILEVPRCILDLPEILGVPWDFTVHDHYPVCPQYNLTDEHGHFCGEPDEAGCARCLSVRPAPWGLDIESWRRLFGHWLVGADRVFVPSRITLARVQYYFPDANYCLAPHPELAGMVEPAPELPPSDKAMSRAVDPPPSIRSGRPFKVLVLGVINPAKGLDLLTRCAWDARNRALPMEYRVLGWFERPMLGGEELPVSCTGPYPRDQVRALITAEQADVMLFPSQAPETWSYTLTEGLQSGLPLVASARGAMLERLAGVERAVLLNPDDDARIWNDAILSLLGESTS